jgi:uncharacterized protein (DUF58 family)
LDFSIPAQGAYTLLADLIALRFPAGQLCLTRKKRALSTLAGPNKSNFRGRGIDFEEVRRYQAGDDIRTIDWRVTARSGNAHTKLFQEERERPVLIVVDQRHSMFFGSRHCFKSVLAAHVASLLTWSALDNGDRIGGLVFNDSEHLEIRPRRSRKTALALISHIERYNHALPQASPQSTTADESSFGHMLHNLRRIAKPGCSIFIVSDFHGAEGERAQEHLFQLAQHTEIAALACSDPLELELPRSGHYAVTNGEHRSELQTSNKAMRQEFHARFLQRRDALSANLQRLGIPLLQASTAEAPFQMLQKYYGGARR